MTYIRNQTDESNCQLTCRRRNPSLDLDLRVSSVRSALKSNPILKHRSSTSRTASRVSSYESLHARQSAEHTSGGGVHASRCYIEHSLTRLKFGLRADQIC